jgi:hypothetical protein
MSPFGKLNIKNDSCMNNFSRRPVSALGENIKAERRCRFIERKKTGKLFFKSSKNKKTFFKNLRFSSET